MARFLWDDLSKKWQVIVFTHQKEWFERLANLFKSEAKLRKVLEWDIKAVKTQGDTWRPLREQARVQIESDEPGAGNVLRMALEEFLDDVCERFSVSVPYKRDPAAVSFETKRNRLVKQLKDLHESGNGIIDPTTAAVRGFETSQALANLASHEPTHSALSGEALREALSDFAAFSDTFVCANDVGGRPCGWELKALKHKDKVGGRFQCPQCRNPFA